MKDRIKALRKSKEVALTQTEFARQLGVEPSSVSRWESGQFEPSGPVIALICKTFGCDELWLRTGEGQMFKPATRNEEISKFFYDVLKEDDESFQKRFVSALASCTPEMWEAFAKFVDDLAK